MERQVDEMAVHHYLLALAILLLCLGCCALSLELRKRWNRKVYSEEEKEEAIKQKREMEELLQSPGWKTLIRIAEAQSLGRKNEVLLKPTENPYQQEYLKGEITGIELILRTPGTVVETAKALIEAANQAEEEA